MLEKASNVYHAFVNFIESVWKCIFMTIIGIVPSVKIIGRLWCASIVAVSNQETRPCKHGTQRMDIGHMETVNLLRVIINVECCLQGDEA
jgi:hypothetical protein